MQIRIPERLVRAFDACIDWLNVPVTSFTFRGKHRELLRLDVVIGVGFVVSTAYYWWIYGWKGGVVGGLIYIALSAISLTVVAERESDRLHDHKEDSEP